MVNSKAYARWDSGAMGKALGNAARLAGADDRNRKRSKKTRRDRFSTSSTLDSKSIVNPISSVQIQINRAGPHLSSVVASRW
jgi:hypothetical protein